MQTSTSRVLNVVADLTIGAVLVAVVVTGRLVPHSPSFTPITAAALFAGFYFRRSAPAMIIPIVSMLVSDLYLGFYNGWLMLVVYGGLAAPALLGPWLKKRMSATTLVGAAVIGSLLSCLTSNLAVWAFTPMYSHDLSGLLSCFSAAVPFFRNKVSGDVFWTISLFVAYGLCCVLANLPHYRQLACKYFARTLGGATAN